MNQIHLDSACPIDKICYLVRLMHHKSAYKLATDASISVWAYSEKIQPAAVCQQITGGTVCHTTTCVNVVVFFGSKKQ